MALDIWFLLLYAWFSLVLLGFTGFHWVLLGFAWFFSASLVIYFKFGTCMFDATVDLGVPQFGSRKSQPVPPVGSLNELSN